MHACTVCGHPIENSRAQICSWACRRESKRLENRHWRSPEAVKRRATRKQARRRERYHTDPAYRKKRLKRNRKRHQERYRTDPIFRERCRKYARERDHRKYPHRVSHEQRRLLREAKEHERQQAIAERRAERERVRAERMLQPHRPRVRSEADRQREIARKRHPSFLAGRRLYRAKRRALIVALRELGWLDEIERTDAKRRERAAKMQHLNAVTPDLAAQLRPPCIDWGRHTIARLRRDRPDLHARVLNGEISLTAARVEAGFNKPKRRDRGPDRRPRSRNNASRLNQRAIINAMREIGWVKGLDIEL